MDNKEFNALLFSFFNSIEAFVCIIDTKNNILRANKRWINSISNDNLGSNFFDYIHQDEIERWLQFWQTATVSSSSSTSNFNTLFKRKDGSVFPAEISVIQNDSSTNNYYLLKVIDITDYENKNDYVQKLDATLQSTSDAVFWGNEEGEFEYVNSIACRMLGYTKDELQSMSIFDIDKNINYDELKQTLSDFANNHANHTHYLESTHYTKNGQALPVEVISKRIWVKSKWSVLSFVRDISKRKRKEQEILRNQKLLKEAQGIAKLGRWELNINKNTFEGSDEFFAITGYDKNEIGQNYECIQKIIPEEDLIELNKIRKQIIKDKHFFNHEHRIIKKDSSIAHVYIVGDIMVNNKGEITRVYGIMQDITDRKKHEEESLKNQRLIIDSHRIAKMGAWEIDFTTNEIIWSKEFYHLIHQNPDQVSPSLDVFFSAVFHKDREMVKKHYVDTLETKIFTDLEFRFVLPDGNIRDFLVAGDMVLNNKGQVVRLYGIIQDITERKRSEKALLKSEQQMQRIFEVAPIGFAIINERTMQKLNSRIYEISGYSEDELLGNNTAMLYPNIKEYERVGKMLWKGMQDNGIGSVESKWKRKDGHLVDIQIISTMMDPNNPSLGILSTTIDISQRKLFQQQLIEAKLKAEESDRLKSAFLANVSHEIRTPMNAIIGFSSFLKDEDLSKEDLHRFADIITTSGEHLLALINDIIDLSKIDSGQLDIIKIDVNLNRVILDIYHIFESYISSKGKTNIELQLNIPEEELIVSTDEMRLRQILFNLIGNAVKFTNEGFIKLTCQKEHNLLKFSIQDSGIGISEAKQEIIFERFQQGSESTEKLYGGTGLGLAIVKLCIELLGGDIHVTSEVGVGSCFTFTIPL